MMTVKIKCKDTTTPVYYHNVLSHFVEGPIEELNKVISKAFPDIEPPSGLSLYYLKDSISPGCWAGYDKNPNLPTQSVKDFL